MKYTIEGFSQRRLIGYGLDAVDALILRYFIDFKECKKGKKKMISRIINSNQYYWIKYEKVIKELPILKLNTPDSVYRRLKKMVKVQVLETITIREGGVFSFYKPGENYYSLISDDFETDANPSQTDIYPTTLDDNPTTTDIYPNISDEKSEQKINLSDKSINNQSINNKSDLIKDELSKYLFTFIKKNNPGAKEPNFKNWSKHMDYILRLDKRNPEEVKQVIEFSQNNNFWCTNILSTEKLRKHYDKLFLQMKNPIKNNKQDGPVTNFNNYDQRSYDYDALEKKLLGWDK